MEEEINTNQEEMTAEESKAALGLATTLTEQMLMSQAQQNGTMPSEEPQEAPEQELEMEAENIDPEALKSDLMKDVKKLIKEEIGGIKDMLKEALNEKETD
jgi:hypothetical protein